MTSPQEQPFGKYRVEAEIGRGGFGVVYRAIDSTLDRPVALKILDPLLSRDAQWARRFQQEARVMARLDHPHIVPIYETSNEAGRVYIAMKLIEGGNLATRIEQGGPLPWPETVRIIRQIAGALDYAHEHGIIHRDLKPGNILLGAGGAVLTDFGLARLVGESTLNPTLSGGMVGTWAYIAPEIWNGAKPEARADIYALGCILYEMVTGQVLFGGENVASIIGSHHKPLLLPTQWPDPVPDGLAAVLHRALHREVASRYATAGTLAMELEQLTEASRTKPPPPPKQERRPISEPVVTNNRDLEPTRPIPARPPGPTAGVIGVGLALVVFVVLGLSVGLWNGLRNAANNQGEENPLVADVVVTATATPSLPPTNTPVTPTNTPVTPTNTPVTPTNILVAGDTRERPTDGMVMVYVPGGTFMMGSDPTVDEDAGNDEQPQHPVTLDSFWIDRTEVTNAQFALFATTTGYTTTAEIEGGGYAYNSNDGWEYTEGANWQHPQGPESNLNALQEHPVVQISWYDAQAYCEWAGGQLPTEAQWEYAARGTEGNLYPWGDIFAGTKANFCDTNCPFDHRDATVNDGYETTAPVGRFPEGHSWVGALDMAGNVWEWVADWYGDYSSAAISEPTGPASGDVKVLRGGSWFNDPVYLRVANRNNNNPVSRNDHIGFRCVVPPGN